MKKELSKYLEENIKIIPFKKAKYKVDNACCTSYADLIDVNNDNLFNLKNSKFQELLNKFIEKKKIKDNSKFEVLNININKILKDDYMPSKNEIILLGIALELKEKELDELLKASGYSLQNENVADLIVRFCFINRCYSIFTINKFLEDYNCNSLDN